MVLEFRKDIKDGEKSEYLIVDFNTKQYFRNYLVYISKARTDLIDSTIYLDKEQDLIQLEYTLVNNGFCQKI